MPPEHHRPRAIVAGAGIAGLTSALALSRAGYSVRVFEQSPRLDPVGAGLQLSPNALDVLYRLGLSNAMDRIGVAADEVVLRSGRNGRVLARVPVSSTDGRGYRALHRGDLQAALVKAVEADLGISLVLGAELRSLKPSGTGIEAAFESVGGSIEASAQLLVAADGVRSTAARILGFPDPRASGTVALRFVAAAASEPTAAIEAWLGSRRHAVRYTINGAGEQNLVLLVPEDDARPEAFQGWEPRLARLVREARPLGSWPLSTVEPRWHARDALPVAFVGDAAHAMLPFAAQGAAMAIEDAWMLATCLADAPDPRSAFSRYASARAPRVGQVLKRVEFHRRVYHLPLPLSLARDLALGLRSPRSLRRDLAWLYDWRAPDFPAGRVGS